MPEWESTARSDTSDDVLMPFDPSKPNIARAYDYLLGGKDHFAPDRELAEKLLTIYPPIRRMVHENRHFLEQALMYVVVQGTAQYIDLGAGLPTRPAVHEIVRRHSHRGAIAYVDNDPVVVSHIRAFAEKADTRVRAVPGDVREPPTVLAAPELAGFIDLARPACLILGLVLHFLDAARAREVASAYVSALAPGSYVIISVGRGDGEIGQQVTSTYDAAPLYNHTPEDVTAFFDGLELVAPGVTEARAWRPGWPAAPINVGRAGQILAGVAKKP